MPTGMLCQAHLDITELTSLIFNELRPKGRRAGENPLGTAGRIWRILLKLILNRKEWFELNWGC
jgi:hypothetical protein